MSVRVGDKFYIANILPAGGNRVEWASREGRHRLFIIVDWIPAFAGMAVAFGALAPAFMQSCAGMMAALSTLLTGSRAQEWRLHRVPCFQAVMRGNDNG